jgi:hypothetical protein
MHRIVPFYANVEAMGPNRLSLRLTVGKRIVYVKGLWSAAVRKRARLRIHLGAPSGKGRRFPGPALAVIHGEAVSGSSPVPRSVAAPGP